MTRTRRRKVVQASALQSGVDELSVGVNNIVGKPFPCGVRPLDPLFRPVLQLVGAHIHVGRGFCYHLVSFIHKAARFD